MRKLLILLASLFVLQHTGAQTELIVDGNLLPGLDQSSVPGVSYAPAEQFARAIGADLEIGFATVELRMAGRLLQLRLTGDAQSVTAPDSVALDGRTLEGYAALHSPGGVLLPVKTVASAFGGFVTVLGGSRDAVDVRLPVARLTGLERSGAGSTERLTVSLSAPVPVTVSHNDRLDTLQITFGRSQMPELPEVAGSAFRQAWFLSSQGNPELRIQLQEGSDWRLSTQPAGSGWQLVISFSERTASALPVTAATQPATVMLDPDAQVALVDLALAVAQQLAGAGLETVLTRRSPDEAAGSLLGAGSADLYLRISAGGSNRLHYLADAAGEAQLLLAVELNSGDAAAVDRLRRELLLGRHGDPGVGRRLAEAMQESLQLDGPALGLPLEELTPASGSGVRLELNPGMLADPGLAERLAAAVLHSLESR